jgi:hypothetical protein
MPDGRVAVLLLAGFFDCGNNGQDSNAEDNPVNKAAWQTGRVLYADIEGDALTSVRDDGAERAVLIELDAPACPSISQNGERITATLTETDELILIRKNGNNSVFRGSGGTVGNMVVSASGDNAAFHELTGDPEGACDPAQVVFANSSGSNQDVIAGDAQSCARWPEFTDDGTVLSYEVRNASDGSSDICRAQGTSGTDLGCLGITELQGMRAYDPDAVLIIGTDFRTWRAEDGVEITDPILEIEGFGPPEGQNDWGEKVRMALEKIGAAPIGSARFPMSLDWGPDRRIVFDALTDGPGGTGVHFFIYDIEEESAVHVLGPLTTAGSNSGEFSSACPRWIP